MLKLAPLMSTNSIIILGTLLALTSIVMDFIPKLSGSCPTV